MNPSIEHTEFDVTEDGHITNLPLEHDCEKCAPMLIKLNNECVQLKHKIKDLLQDRKEIFIKHEQATKQLHQTHLDSTNKLIQQETAKWGVHTKNLQRQIENLNDKAQLYQTSKQLVEDQLKNISQLLEIYEVESDIEKKIDCKRQLHSMCGIVTHFDEQKERQQMSDNSQQLQEYKAILKEVDQCLAKCQQQLLDPSNELQLEKLKGWVVGLIRNSALSSELKQSILDNIAPHVSNLNYTIFMERLLEVLLNATPHCYLQSNTESPHSAAKYSNNLEQQKQLYEKKIQHLEQMCEINQRETLRASEEIQEHLKNEIARLKDSIISMEKGHMDDLRIMEERCRDFQQDIQSNIAETKALSSQFNEENEVLKTKVQNLHEQLDVINENRKDLSNELTTYQSKYNTQHEINKSLHHALNTLRNESSVQYQMILDQCEIDKKAVVKDCDEQIELLKQQLESQEQLKTTNQHLKEEITKLTDRINELKFRATSDTPNNPSQDFDYDSTIIRILKSTLIAYHKADPQKKHEVYSVLCGILGVSKDDINNLHNSRLVEHQEKSFVSNLPIIGRLWSNNNSNQTLELNQTLYDDNTSFTSLLQSYLEKESNTPTLPRMSNSDIDSLVGAISQAVHQQPTISTTLTADTSPSSTQPAQSSSISPQLNLSNIIEEQTNPTIEP